MAFGQLLREGRERKGWDLNQTARRLRIRPDILRAIENNDFANMPPRGYTRNMVNAYAKAVGLNPTEITRMYLDEFQDFTMRASQRSSSYDSRFQRDAGYQRGSRDSTRRSARTARGSERETTRESRQSSSRTARNDRYEEARDYGRRSADRASSSSSRTGRVSLRDDDERGTSPRYVSRPNMEYTNFYSGSIQQGNQSNMLIYIMAVVVVIAIILAVLLFVSCSSNNDDEESVSTTVPITGMTDTTASDDDDADSESDGDSDSSATTTTTSIEQPTSAEFVYEVLDGETAYIEVYLDDGNASVASSIEGPTTNTFTVTGTIKFVTTNPDGVVITLDGEEVEAVDLYGKGVYTYTFDFDEYLEEWAEENGVTLVDTSSDEEEESDDATEE